MNWLDKLERKLGRFAVRNLMTYIVILNAVAFMLMYVDPTGNYIGKIVLDPELVLKGQVWRLVTFISIPPETSVLWIIFALYFYYLVGSALEHEWGSFRFNVYYLIGMAATIAASFVTGAPATALYLNLSLFLAFARVYPDYQLMIFFLLPVKVKYLAWLNWAFLAYTIGNWRLPAAPKYFAAASIVNFIIFFGKDIIVQLKTGKQVYRNRRQFRAELPRNITIHRCTICGITEKDDPKMEFRYCMDCDGDYEYCMEHLSSHEHIKNKSAG